MPEGSGPVKHLFLRIPRKRKEIADFRSAHDEVSRACGAVWIALTGRSLSRVRKEELVLQLERRITTYLYVVQMVKPGGVFEAYRSRILEIASSHSQIETALVPEYYTREGIIAIGRCWIKASSFERVVLRSLQSLHVAQSGKRCGCAEEKHGFPDVRIRGRAFGQRRE
jgi:hypothetical protein